MGSNSSNSSMGTNYMDNTMAYSSNMDNSKSMALCMASLASYMASKMAFTTTSMASHSMAFSTIL